MPADYNIDLNFLSFVGDVPDFVVFRKLRQSPQEPRPEGGRVHAYSLPRTHVDVEDRDSYWVFIGPREGFEQLAVRAADNHDLTKWAVLSGIEKRCWGSLKPADYWFPEEGFVREVHFNMLEHQEGTEQLIVRPYYLRAAERFGLVADF